MKTQELLAIRIYTFGHLRMERNDGSEWLTVTDATWQHQRVRLLLRCLISLPHRRVDRTVLLNRVWSSIDHENANGRLDRAVHDLRRVFEPEREKPATSPLLFTQQGMVALADQQFLWIDADAFEQSIAQAHRSEDSTVKERCLEEARMLYRGDFLPEDSLATAVQRRVALFHCMIALLFELAELQMQREALSEAIDSLRQLLSMDPTHEAASQFLMRTLERIGQRGEALRVYKRLSSALQHSLHIVPSSETRSLYEIVRNDLSVRSEASRIASSQEIPTPLCPHDGLQQGTQTPPQDYEFIDVLRGNNETRDTIYMTLFDDHAIQFFLLAVIRDALHFPIGSEFQFHAYHPDAPSSPHVLLPDAPVGTAIFRKHAQSIEVITTTGILTPLVVKFGFINSANTPSIWKIQEEDISKGSGVIL